MESNLQITLLIVSTVGAGILAQVVAGFLRLPSIVFLLLFGLALGRSGLNLIHPDWLGNGLEVMVPLAVALILFEGGLNLELRTSEAVSGSIRNDRHTDYLHRRWHGSPLVRRVSLADRLSLCCPGGGDGTHSH